ncbi:MAG: AAA family ATPase, partial [Raoultibacter sp.]
MEQKGEQRPTVIVNIFGGPGAGKTTAAFEISEKLKKLGYVVDYAPEYAKELVWTISSSHSTAEQKHHASDLLNGSTANQTALYAEQKHRVDRLLGQCDFVVTDSPALLGCMYLKADSAHDHEAFTQRALVDFKQQNNFNLVVKRAGNYEAEGRLQSASEAAQIDGSLIDFLADSNIYTGTYHHETIDLAIENMQKTLTRLKGQETKKGEPAMEVRAEDWRNIEEIAKRNGQKKSTQEKGKATMNETTNTETPIAAEGQASKLEWVNITMKGVFLKELTNKETGNKFFDVRIPEGTKVGGAIDVGNYHFTIDAARVHDSKYDPNGVQLGLIKDKPLKLTKSTKQPDGTYQDTSMVVQPENLRVAVNEQFKNYKAAKAAERAATRPEQAVAKSAPVTPTTDQKAAVKSAAARSKS